MAEDNKNKQGDVDPNDPNPDGGDKNTESFTKAELEAEADRRVSKALQKREKEWETKLEEVKQANDPTKIQELQDELNKERKARVTVEEEKEFVKQASQQNVVDADAALLIARDLGYLKDDGKTDWETLKKDRPYLFKTEQSPGPTSTNAGRIGGSSNNSNTTSSRMNKVIRKTAGY